MYVGMYVLCMYVGTHLHTLCLTVLETVKSAAILRCGRKGSGLNLGRVTVYPY